MYDTLPKNREWQHTKVPRVLQETYRVLRLETRAANTDVAWVPRLQVFTCEQGVLEDLLAAAARRLGVPTGSMFGCMIAYALEAWRQFTPWHAVRDDFRPTLFAWWQTECAPVHAMRVNANPNGPLPVLVRFAYAVDRYPNWEMPLWYSSDRPPFSRPPSSRRGVPHAH